jgi:DmsE family decaheme c-type cytochrome
MIPSARLLPLLVASLARPAPAQEVVEGSPSSEASCAGCHPGSVRAILSGAHAPTVESAALDGCATCHGPGEKHARTSRPADILGFSRLSAERTTGSCALCHASEIRAYHRWDESEFKEAGKRCTDCHRVHEPRGARLAERDLRRFLDPPSLAAAATPVGAETCASCHGRQAQRLGLSDHAKLAPGGEDTRGCEVCHGPGSLHAEAKGVRRLITRPDGPRAGGIATCRECHSEVDPVTFHWEKPPLLAAESCAVCHRVHAPREEGWKAGLWAEGPPGEFGGYAGDATCRRCHAPAFGDLGDTNHRPRPVDADDPPHRGCEGCHGPGATHAASGGRKALEGGRFPGDAACFACHREAQHFARWPGSDHARAGISCRDCHPVAQPSFPAKVQRASDRCATCHPDVAAQFRLPTHHPLPEGAIRCTDCHDPHQGSARTNDLALGRDACVNCHREKAGPFLFHHEADRVEGCVVCHEPHGSVNRRLLTQPTTHTLCLQCHSDTPLFHDQAPGSFWRRCVDCHAEIHGSQLDRLYFR